MNLALFDTTARRQHGLVTRKQALLTGSRGEIDGLVRSGVLVSIRRGVYRMAGTPKSWVQDLAAALLQRPGAVASHASAASLWDLAPGWHCATPEITVLPTALNRMSQAKVRRSELSAYERVTLQGLPVTSPARTIVDLAAISTPQRLELALDDALRRRLTTLPEVSRCLDANRRPGPPRVRRLDAVLLARTEQATESPLERKVLAALNKARLPSPVAQHSVLCGMRPYRLDFAWPAARVGIEVNGFTFHSVRTVFDADAAKMVDLAGSGWTIFPVTSRTDIGSLITSVAQRLRAAA